MNKEQKAEVEKYNSLDKEAKKKAYKEAKSPLKNLLVWKKMKVWFIPVVSVISVVTLVAVPVLAVAGEQLMITLLGSPVIIYDTEASKQAALEAENKAYKY